MPKFHAFQLHATETHFLAQTQSGNVYHLSNIVSFTLDLNVQNVVAVIEHPQQAPGYELLRIPTTRAVYLHEQAASLKEPPAPLCSERPVYY